MKVLVFSDSHGTTEYMVEAVKREQPYAVVHLGDHARDADVLDRAFPLMPLCRVKGNCDLGDMESPTERLIQWGSCTIFASHGHRYGVKGSIMNFYYAALERGAQVALFGHTHRACCEEMGGLWLLNPGACGGRAPTYGIINIEENGISCCVKDFIPEETV